MALVIVEHVEVEVNYNMLSEIIAKGQRVIHLRLFFF